jgi:hypothetical protein
MVERQASKSTVLLWPLEVCMSVFGFGRDEWLLIAIIRHRTFR